MNDEQEKLIDEQFKTLPKNLQRAIALSPWRFHTGEIGKAYNLTPEQIADLERETMFVVYGFEPATDYINNTMREMNLSQETAEKIAESVAEKIFEPILNKKDELDKNEMTENQKEENYMTPSKPSDGSDPRSEVVERLEQAANLPEIAPEIHPEIAPKIHPQEIVDSKQYTADSGANSSDKRDTISSSEETLSIPPKEPQAVEPLKRTYPDGQDPYREPIG